MELHIYLNIDIYLFLESGEKRGGGRVDLLVLFVEFTEVIQ